MVNTRGKLYGLSYDELIIFSIADCQGEELRTLIATSRGFPTELGNIRVNF